MDGMTGRDQLWRLHAQADPGQAIHPQRLGREARHSGHQAGRPGLGKGNHGPAGYVAGYAAGRADAEGGLHASHPRGAAGGGGGGGGRKGCRGRMLLVLLLLPLLPLLMLVRHRAPEPKPGDRGWQHPHVLGSTDPAEIARILREAEAIEQAVQDRIRRERWSR